MYDELMMIMIIIGVGDVNADDQGYQISCNIFPGDSPIGFFDNR